MFKRDSFSSRRPYTRRRNSGDRSEYSESNGSHSAHSNHSIGRGQGRPPGLIGKQIGLYYRDRARAKTEEKGKHIIKLVPNIEDKVKHVLDKCNGFYYTPCNNKSYIKDRNNTFGHKYAYIQDSQFKKMFLNIVSGNIQVNLAIAALTRVKLERDADLAAKLLNELKSKEHSEEYKNLKKFRCKLPAYEKKSHILELVENNQVVIISGETGCGKTTQVPQFILDDQIERGNGDITKIICTQPRRISAISVAERVAAERAEELGRSVGFQIRLEKVSPRNTGSILFCTNGMLLQFLKSDPALNNFSHIILDEIHERSTESDFTLALLKLIIPKKPDLKVILMSATLNSEKFSEYYNNCPMIHIPGFTYPVEEFYLEDILSFTGFQFPVTTCYRPYGHEHGRRKQNCQEGNYIGMIIPYIHRLTRMGKYSMSVINQLQHPESETMSLDLIEKLIAHICRTKPPGAILVFLPGMWDIMNLQKMMLRSDQYPESQYVIYPLHSRMPTIDQKLIFKEPADGVRKIILATSIAETSITIEDVVYVINCGKTKFNKFDIRNNTQILMPEWVSLANAKQRRGRAGRVRPGICYHLYTKARETTFEHYPLPEMLRTSLDQLILQMKSLQLGKVRPFLASVIDPPDKRAIQSSLDLLESLNALDDEENLTPFGYQLSKLPLDPRIGKMVIWASLFSCVKPVFAIAASLSFKDAFYTPHERQDQAMKMKLELNNNQFSDHIAFAEALLKFEQADNRGDARRFCNQYFLSFNTLKLLSEMTSQFGEQLHDMKFLETNNVSDKNANRNSNNMSLVKTIICICLYPNIAIVREAMKHKVSAWTLEGDTITIHPSSVNGKMGNCPSRFITYFMKQRSSAIFAHDTTYVSTAILLFAAKNIGRRNGKQVCILSLSPTEVFYCDFKSAQLLQKLQIEVNNMFEYKMSHPGPTSWNTVESDLLNAVIDFVSQKDEDMEFAKKNAVQSDQ